MAHWVTTWRIGTGVSVSGRRSPVSTSGWLARRVIATALVLGAVLVPAARLEAAELWVSGYYVGYEAAAYPPSSVDYSAMTHVLMFSALPRSDGTLNTAMFIDAINGPKVAIDVAQRAHGAGRKALLTIGGEGTEAAFRGATSSTNMSRFVQNLVQTIDAWGYDGIDIDWEPITSADFPYVLALVNNLRAAKAGIIITVAVGWQSVNFPLSTSEGAFYTQLANAVDQMNMMTYGMADNWGGWVSWHSSALFGEGPNHPSSVSSSARIYTNAGVPAAKLGMGIGFYGSCWNAPTTAPLQALGSSNVVESDNTMSAAAIQNQYAGLMNRFYDAGAESPYLSSSLPAGPAGCTFVSYEDERSVAAKGEYARAAGLGGTIIWQINEGYNPAAADPNGLLRAVGAAFLRASEPLPPPPAPTPTSTQISVVSGSPQSTQVATAFPVALQTRVVDGSGNPLSGVAVTFTAAPGGATVTFNGMTSATAVTDASGVATAPNPLASSQAGSYAVTATTVNGTQAVQFQLTNTATSSLRVRVTGGTPQSTRVSKPFPQRLQLTVTDSFSNPVGNVTVTFFAPTGGAGATFGDTGLLTVAVTTNASGAATSPVVRANADAGSYIVTAVANGTATTQFDLSNTGRGKGR